MNKKKNISEIREEIKNGRFQVLPPDKMFDKWVSNGVFLQNTALTCETSKPKSHDKIWSCFTKNIIIEIAKTNKQTTWLLWGEEAKSYEVLINQYPKNNLIIESSHPARQTFVGSGIFKSVINKYCVLN